MGQQMNAIGAALRPSGSPGGPKVENRREPRCRSSLRSGHIADGPRGFICNCVVRDYSTKGARLLLPKNVLAPKFIWFYDDEQKKAIRAEVRWQKGQEIGIFKMM